MDGGREGERWSKGLRETNGERGSNGRKDGEKETESMGKRGSERQKEGQGGEKSLTHGFVIIRNQILIYGFAQNLKKKKKIYSELPGDLWP